MKQYRFKQDFGYCKSGTISKYHEDMNVYGFEFLNTKKRKISKVFDIEEIQLLIKQGYLEECKEPKWTDEDMFDLLKYANHHYFIQDDIENYSVILKEYEKSRQEFKL